MKNKTLKKVLLIVFSFVIVCSALVACDDETSDTTAFETTSALEESKAEQKKDAKALYDEARENFKNSAKDIAVNYTVDAKMTQTIVGFGTTIGPTETESKAMVIQKIKGDCYQNTQRTETLEQDIVLEQGMCFVKTENGYELFNLTGEDKAHVTFTQEEYETYLNDMNTYTEKLNMPKVNAPFAKEAFYDAEFTESNGEIIFTGSRINPSYKDLFRQTLLGMSEGLSNATSDVLGGMGMTGGADISYSIDEDSISYKVVVKDGKIVSESYKATITLKMSSSGVVITSVQEQSATITYEYGIDDILSPADWDYDNDTDLTWEEYKQKYYPGLFE